MQQETEHLIKRMIRGFMLGMLAGVLGYMLVCCRWGCSRRAAASEDEAAQMIDVKYCKDGVVRELKMVKKQLPHGA